MFSVVTVGPSAAIVAHCQPDPQFLLASNSVPELGYFSLTPSSNSLANNSYDRTRAA